MKSKSWMEYDRSKNVEKIKYRMRGTKKYFIMYKGKLIYAMKLPAYLLQESGNLV